MSWTRFTKRTDDPKLSWLQRQLNAAGIPNRRNGHSFHAPILEVPVERLDEAWAILDPVDEIEDDDPMFSCECPLCLGDAEDPCDCLEGDE